MYSNGNCTPNMLGGYLENTTFLYESKILKSEKRNSFDI